MSVRTLVIAAAIAVLGVAGFVVVRLTHKPLVNVWVVNGLDVPVEANVMGKRITVEPHRHASVAVKGRSMWVVVTLADGTEVDREKLTPKQSDIVFNPLGAAPLAVVGQLYSVHGITMDKPSASQDIWYARVVEHEHVHYYFEAPAKVALQTTKGPTEKRILRIHGTWDTTARWLAENRRTADAQKLVDAVRALQPESETATAFSEQLARKPEPPAKPKTKHDWITTSADQQAKLIQESSGRDACKVRCELAAGVAWTTETCIATDEDSRFVAPDCTRTVIIRPMAGASEPWRDSNVYFVYEHAKLVQSHTAGQLMTGEGAPNIAGRGYWWIKDGPRLSSDAREIELQTMDGKQHKLPFLTAP